METFLKVRPIGTRRVIAHLNFGFRDRRNGFREIEMPEYPPEDVAAGEAMRKARIAAGLGLRDAAKALAFTPVQLSAVERGEFRFIEPADRDSVLAFYAAQPRAAPPAPALADALEALLREHDERDPEPDCDNAVAARAALRAAREND